MHDCLFCRIVNGELNTTILAENEHVLAFNDINPQAPTHILIIPKTHITTLNDAPDDDPVLSAMITMAKTLAHSLGFAEAGYRLALNCLHDGGQEVPHIHLHLLAGRQMTWPPG